MLQIFRHEPRYVMHPKFLVISHWFKVKYVYECLADSEPACIIDIGNKFVISSNRGKGKVSYSESKYLPRCSVTFTKLLNCRQKITYWKCITYCCLLKPALSLFPRKQVYLALKLLLKDSEPHADLIYTRVTLRARGLYLPGKQCRLFWFHTRVTEIRI